MNFAFEEAVEGRTKYFSFENRNVFLLVYVEDRELKFVFVGSSARSNLVKLVEISLQIGGKKLRFLIFGVRQ